MHTSIERLSQIREENANEQIIFRAGCYDILHEGHVEALEYSRSLADMLVVGLWSDARVRERKGPTRPVRNQEARAKLVGAVGVVGHAFVMPEDRPRSPSMIQVMESLRPDMFIVASANLGHPNDSYIQNELGIEIVPDTRPAITSTTGIIYNPKQTA